MFASAYRSDARLQPAAAAKQPLGRRFRCSVRRASRNQLRHCRQPRTVLPCFICFRARSMLERTFRDARSTAAKVAAALAHFLSATARLVALRRLRSRGSFGPRCEACWAVRLLHDRNATAICLRDIMRKK